jgi:hypothetical protein
MQILFDSHQTVKPSTFGSGLIRWVPPSTAYEPSDAERSEAARLFDELERAACLRELEERAEQARYDDRFNGSLPVGLCDWCSEPADWLDPVHQLCGDCMTAAENATIACSNWVATRQRRVF